VAASPLLTFDLADYADSRPRVNLDIAPILYKGLILREQDFRDWVAAHNWEQYSDKHVFITNSADAIVPGWAWMILAIELQPFAATVVLGSSEDLEREVWKKVLDQLDFNQFQGKKIVVKGCGDLPIPTSVYVDLIVRLRPLAQKLMYGEPCSTVPLYKQLKTQTSLR